MTVTEEEELLMAPLKGMSYLRRAPILPMSLRVRFWCAGCTGFTRSKCSGRTAGGVPGVGATGVYRFTIAGTGRVAAPTGSRTWSRCAGTATT